jgi:hypothetical protein
MLPDRCSIREKKGDCPNPPSHVVSIVHGSGEYMVGVVCDEHKCFMEKRLTLMQNRGELLHGKIKFDVLKTVVTDCVTNYPDKWNLEMDD